MKNLSRIYYLNGTYSDMIYLTDKEIIDLQEKKDTIAYVKTYYDNTLEAKDESP